eukprot:CAMPEP_0175057818 /NCGR_PEP_ID=MMETSP0052_2-20121109/11477_1 /TAXON_ID=51329 ORGANISM="Polytomella parva, Strain SAG 63-3" /NCGR_SAMPLE_ID=MMETSP0052_2 /ASSEMBLY_ACC=CAM_ASM_000194 /LENGTH=281 /DNA_ID=CAMNT_0016323077 /DNA_START=56 /DNA_END=898 /DNA_ORIENTATION=+
MSSDTSLEAAMASTRAESPPVSNSSSVPSSDPQSSTNKLDCVKKACSGVVDAFKKMKLEMKKQNMQGFSLPPRSASSPSDSASSPDASPPSSIASTSTLESSSSNPFSSTNPNRPDPPSPPSDPPSSCPSPSAAAAADTDSEESVFPAAPSDLYYGYGPQADQYSNEMSVFFGADEWQAMRNPTPSPAAADSTQPLPAQSDYAYAACPPTTSEIGPATWTFLHSLAAYYPSDPNAEQKQLMRTMLKGLGAFYPCHVCAEHLRVVMEEEPPKVSSNLALSLW